MKLQILFQNQWGPHYGGGFNLFGLSFWKWGGQILLFNFRIYIRLTDDPDGY